MRTLSTAIQNLIAQQSQRTCHLLTFSVGANTYRFAEDAVTHIGGSYLPHLAVVSGPRYSEKPQLEPVRVELQNITLETARMLQADGMAAQGQEATLERLFLAAGETVILFRGRISEIEVDERNATLTLAGDLDPTAARLPARKYSSLCVWNFTDANCGYTAGVDPDDPGTGQPFLACPKDFASCQERGRQHRFPGFLHITRELTEAVEGQNAAPPSDDALSSTYTDF